VRERGIPAILLPLIYGSCMRIMSVSSSSIIFRLWRCGSAACLFASQSRIKSAGLISMCSVSFIFLSANRPLIFSIRPVPLQDCLQAGASFI
jgi:hypothetical protein